MDNARTSTCARAVAPTGAMIAHPIADSPRHRRRFPRQGDVVPESALQFRSATLRCSSMNAPLPRRSSSGAPSSNEDHTSDLGPSQSAVSSGLGAAGDGDVGVTMPAAPYAGRRLSLLRTWWCTSSA